MENLALIESFSEFKDEKLIDRVTLMVILEEVFRNTLKRKFGSDENFDIIINPCLLYTSPSPRDISGSRMPSSA